MSRGLDSELNVNTAQVAKIVSMTRKLFLWTAQLAGGFCLIFFLARSTSADEWKARHPVYSVNGVLTLNGGPSPEETSAFGPASPEDAAQWRENFKSWRLNRLTRWRYDDSQYGRKDLEWTQHVFSQVQLLIWDRSFYDSDKGEYTVDKFLKEIESRLGTIDAVLVWHVYPNIGVDDRNQFDLLRDSPDGLIGLRRMVRQFHDRGVKVFFPTIAWDTGTREETDASWTTLARLLAEIDADGVNFDTLDSIPAQFRRASDATGHPLVLEPQSDPRDSTVAWSNLAWNDWVSWDGIEYPFIPMASRTKWLEPRHMVNITDRYARDKTDSLQHAFFNGQGYASLENLWGHWYGTSDHDAEVILRVTSIERTFAGNLSNAGWEPYTSTLQPGVFASKFPGVGSLWTMVNRNEYDVSGEQLAIKHRSGVHYYDFWHGTEITPVVRDNVATLSFPIEALGFGAVLATTDLSEQANTLLQKMAERSKRSLKTYSREWKAVPQEIVENTRTKPVGSAPLGMLHIPSADYDFQVRGIEVEGGNDPGVDVQFPWESLPTRTHRHRIHVENFYIDRFPVTNNDFKRFLDAAHYHPADSHNFLRDWKSGHYPKGAAKKPVTWVSIEDARAYAAWAGKRLPHEWEWQYAAQATDGRLYPWGNDWNPSAVPPADYGPSMRTLSDVDAHGAGASPYGILDLEGNVSQWTDEYRDQHTRAAIVRGGAAYRPLGSMWYFPQTYRLNEHQKYLLVSPGRDRAGTIGFRCVVDGK